MLGEHHILLGSVASDFVANLTSPVFYAAISPSASRAKATTLLLVTGSVMNICLYVQLQFIEFYIEIVVAR